MPKVYGTMGSGEYGSIPSGSKGNGEMGGIPTDESLPNVSRGPDANRTSGLGSSGGMHVEKVDGFTSGKTERPVEKTKYR